MSFCLIHFCHFCWKNRYILLVNKTQFRSQSKCKWHQIMKRNSMKRRNEREFGGENMMHKMPKKRNICAIAEHRINDRGMNNRMHIVESFVGKQHSYAYARTQTHIQWKRDQETHKHIYTLILTHIRSVTYTHIETRWNDGTAKLALMISHTHERFCAT